MCKQAEKWGYIVAAPLGYRINGGYGRISAAGGPVAPQTARTALLSDNDAMNVMELVAAEYNVDRSRIYIMGNSMGGSGTFLLGAKYAEKFTAMAPAGSGIADTAAYTYDRIKNMPVMLVIGELDAGLQRATYTAKILKERGINVDLQVVEGGTHPTAVEIMIPKIYEFFNAHPKKTGI